MFEPESGLDGFSTSTFLLQASDESKQRFPQTHQLGPCATFHLRGRIDTDFIATTQSAANTAIFGDLGDVIGLRRAWLGAEGDLGDSARYITEIDLASGDVVPRDVFAGYGELDEAGEYRAGHFLEPFSLELGTNSNYFPFMEQSAVNLLDPARNWGVANFRANTNDDSTLTFGAFWAGIDQGDFQGGDGSTIGFTSRYTIAPINEDDGKQLLHFGIALSERIPEHGTIIVSQTPRNPLLDLGDSASSPFVPTIVIPAKFQQLINLQFAGANGSFWAQSEWYGTLIDQVGAGDVFFHGGYASCGHFLTGEHRTYLATSGVLGTVRVDHPVFRCPLTRDRELGWGAWELAARFAYLDFVDSDTPTGASGQLLGINLPTATFGINWYLTDHMRMLFNYNYEVPDERNAGSSVANIFGMRLNVSW